MRGLDVFTSCQISNRPRELQPVEQIEIFEAVASARRLFDLTISLTLGPEHLGMTA